MNYRLVIRIKGQSEQEHSLESQLKYAKLDEYYYYFNTMFDENGYDDPEPTILPSIDNGVFTIVCAVSSPTEKINVLLKVDVASGKVISEEEISRKPVVV